MAVVEPALTGVTENCGSDLPSAQTLAAGIDSDWGSTQLVDRRGRLPATAARHPDVIEWAMTWFRRGASPNTVRALNAVLRSSDLRAELVAIETPTLSTRSSLEVQAAPVSTMPRRCE